jgi:acyl carrier protein
MIESADSAGAAALTPTESVVSAIWAELLQRPTIEPADNFFDHGGDSMMAMIVQFRVTEELHVEIPPGAIGEAPTLSGFCALIDRLRTEKDPAAGVLAPTEEMGTL